MIQDKIMAVCLVTFLVSLIPQVVKNYRTKRCGIVWQTSLMTALASYCVTGCVLSLGLWFTGAVDFLVATLWVVMLCQWFAYRKLVGCKCCKHRMPLWWRMASICSITGKEHEGRFICGRFTKRRGGSDEY